jgi:hypothetical protein
MTVIKAIYKYRCGRLRYGLKYSEFISEHDYILIYFEIEFATSLTVDSTVLWDMISCGTNYLHNLSTSIFSGK